LPTNRRWPRYLPPCVAWCSAWHKAVSLWRPHYRA